MLAQLSGFDVELENREAYNSASGAGLGRGTSCSHNCVSYDITSHRPLQLPKNQCDLMSPSFCLRCIVRLAEIGDAPISKGSNCPAKTKLRTKGKVKNMMQKRLSGQTTRGALGQTGICGIAIAVAAIAFVPAQAQDLRPVHFGGVLNDYSPSTV